MAFHNVRFPTGVSLGARGGPERRTDIVALASGREERNSRWADSRRRFNAGYGVRSLDDLNTVIEFFEERRGRLHAFRWRDHTDYKSCAVSATPAATDQILGTGDGQTANFQLRKRYGSEAFGYWRTITKPVEGSTSVAVDGQVQIAGAAFVVDPLSGEVVFQPGHIPPFGDTVTAGFLFDVPVRFDSDQIEISAEGLSHGAIPAIPIIEVRV